MNSHWLKILWASPTSAVGAPLALLTLISGGQAHCVDGVLEVHGPAARFFLERIVGIFLSGGASAITFGHIVLARDAQLLELTRSHERIHVRQCERWGPLFLPVYLGASLWALARGKRAYEDNFLEREAFQNSR
jgi:hypothetical protein